MHGKAIRVGFPLQLLPACIDFAFILSKPRLQAKYLEIVRLQIHNKKTAITHVMAVYTRKK
ncbi:hypothetical protein SAMN04489710_1255 [Paracidovorax konjaci]|uniref:Uncharacterized protein n=1 Tax=Paracidovorax konjaci TaxID=32040 RepID=A0A1I1ZB46_9BURK|nr:hypothetical protein SAMN04489710_1255 [Paracidovorax konjaci]